MADHNDIILKIINCVKQYPALYDTAHEDYNRYYKKIQIWNSIAAEVNYSDGKSAQTKWRNIRDSYVKHLKSLQTTEPAYRKYRNWQWVDQMSFLKKFLGGNKHKNANKSLDNAETSLIEVVESVYGDPSNFNESEPTEVIAGQKRKSDAELWFNNESVQQDCENFYQKDYVVESNTIDSNFDATDLLFLSYAKTLKSFSTKRQVQVKMKMCELMGHAELDELNEKNVESNHVDSSENICDIRIPEVQGTIGSKGVSEADSSDKERKKKMKS